MGFQAEVLNVLIASPSDVRKQRDEIEAVIHVWNRKYSEQLKVVLLPRRWEKDVFPSFRGSDPQKIINEQIVQDADLAISVFGTKLGTPTSDHESGTLEEIQVLIDNGKDVMVYFVQDVRRLDDLDLNEVARLQAFKKEYGGKGIYFDYDQLELIDHLYNRIVARQKKAKKRPSDILKKIYSMQNLESPGEVDEAQISEFPYKPDLNRLILEELSTNAKLLLCFMMGQEVSRLFGAWKQTETMKRIFTWEESEGIVTELRDRASYEKALLELEDQELVVRITPINDENASVYEMPKRLFNGLINDLNQNAYFELLNCRNLYAVPPY